MLSSFARSIPASSRRLFATQTVSYEDPFDMASLEVAELVKHYASQSQTSISLQDLSKTGLEGNTLSMGRLGRRLARERKLVEMAQWLQHEIPIRLAQRIDDLHNVPLMKDMPSVQQVKSIYVQSFLELLDFPPIETVQHEVQFANALAVLYQKHSSVLVQMAKGAYQLRESMHSQTNGRAVLPFEHMGDCHKFLDRFYTSRIGIRVLAGQYLSLRDFGDRHNHWTSDYIGMICLKTSPSEIVQMAAMDATNMCLKTYGNAPQVDIEGQLDLTFAYIPTYLQYMVMELLKNAMRATAEFHTGTSQSLPPVTVVVADGLDQEDVVIKIADEGGGIPRSQVDHIWSYLFTTADSGIQLSLIGQDDHGDAAPIAGLGYGLPISRSYCRYFGGDLDLVSMEGYGTDAFLHLKRIGDSKEPVPL